MKHSPSKDQTLAVPWDSLSFKDYIFDLSGEEVAFHIECQLPPIHKLYEYLHIYYNLEIRFHYIWD